MADKPKHIVAKRVEGKKRTKRAIYAEVCFFYPQYTLKDVANLPARDIELLIKTARRIEAEKNYELTQIVSAPHSEKGKGVKRLLDKYEREANR